MLDLKGLSWKRSSENGSNSTLRKNDHLGRKHSRRHGALLHRASVYCPNGRFSLALNWSRFHCPSFKKVLLNPAYGFRWSVTCMAYHLENTLFSNCARLFLLLLVSMGFRLKLSLTVKLSLTAVLSILRKCSEHGALRHNVHLKLSHRVVSSFL